MSEKQPLASSWHKEIGFEFFDLDYEVEIYYAKPIEFLKKEFFTKLQQILGEPHKELSFSVWGREK